VCSIKLPHFGGLSAHSAGHVPPFRFVYDGIPAHYWTTMSDARTPRRLIMAEDRNSDFTAERCIGAA
jgi:hypothetical protein